MSRRKAATSKEIHAQWWDPHEVVIIRSLSGPDHVWVQDQAASVNPAEGAMRLKVGTQQQATLIRGIETWTFTDEAGTPLPWPPFSLHESENAAICRMREKSLEQVYPEDLLFIYGEINKLNQPMTEPEKKGSSSK